MEQKIFCHRGFYGVTDIGPQHEADAKGVALKTYPPENSEESIEAAFKQGLSVEIDVTMTKDGHIIVTHTNDLTVHSKDAKPGDYVSEKTFEEIQAMQTGLAGKTAPFLTYERFIELFAESLRKYPSVSANIEIKGTIQAKLMVEPQNPSLIDKLVETTPDDLQPRLIWSSFATSNIVKMKERKPKARVAQLFAEPARLIEKSIEDPVYRSTSDLYMQFTVENLKKLDPRIKGAHPSIDSLMTAAGAAAAKYCAENKIAIRTWALGEKNPGKNEEAKKQIMNVLNLKKRYPDLSIDIITDYAPDVQSILREAALSAPLPPRNRKAILQQSLQTLMISAIYDQWKFDAPILSLCVNRNGDWLAAALADGTARLLPASDEAIKPKVVAMHDGISLSLQPDADEHAFLSGGDDGKVLILDPLLGQTTLLAEHKNQWIDHVASSAEGDFRAYNTGKHIHVLNEEGVEKFDPLLAVPSNPGAICFSPNGKRLAVSHYNGVSLWWMNAKETTPETLEWKGSHLGLIWSPDGKTLLSSMQENALHGWQIQDKKEMRMQGYVAKVRSMGFTARGKYLATSGAEQVICWPFSGGGPWGKPPLTLGGADNRLVTAVAPHPEDAMVAAGYSDGMIVLAPLDGRMEIMINPPKDAPINGLVWNAAGDVLFASTESGTLFLFTTKSVRKALVNAG